MYPANPFIRGSLDLIFEDILLALLAILDELLNCKITGTSSLDWDIIFELRIGQSLELIIFLTITTFLVLFYAQKK